MGELCREDLRLVLRAPQIPSVLVTFGRQIIFFISLDLVLGARAGGGMDLGLAMGLVALRHQVTRLVCAVTANLLKNVVSQHSLVVHLCFMSSDCSFHLCTKSLKHEFT
ncbi:hypothetical protein KC19_8G156600 [Ceratodon purpureus]|uniref:Uncharacterized protein n=1 Tax=Ceratodon purpureus TaxID=3225 RepID=A0A8T0H3V0_CERPU|nr:hypothetical protein KC19_8G156600 [Ceratodon purpureus]